MARAASTRRKVLTTAVALSIVCGTGGPARALDLTAQRAHWIDRSTVTWAAGPTDGKVVLRDGVTQPESVAIVHCVGSRDQNYNEYCSKVCCMYSLKFAHMVHEKTGAQVYNFYIDMRTPGKGYEEFYHRLLIAGQQILIGIALGFLLQMAFQALVFGGQVMAYSMGLGFAHMMDPANGVQVPVVAQFWLILAMLAFLMMNGHLVLIAAVVDTFTVLPVATDGLTRAGIWDLLGWASRMFAAGLLMAMPLLSGSLPLPSFRGGQDPLNGFGPPVGG